MAGERRTLVSIRYPAIDILRGLALVSMISTHMDNFALSSVTGRALHSGRWIDGAFFFVALSGLVTGLVHRRVMSGWASRPVRPSSYGGPGSSTSSTSSSPW